MKKIFLGICLCAGVALASCGHKVDANNVTDTAATTPGISTDSSGKTHDSTTMKMKDSSSTSTGLANGSTHNKADSAAATKHPEK